MRKFFNILVLFFFISCQEEVIIPVSQDLTPAQNLENLNIPKEGCFVKIKDVEEVISKIKPTKTRSSQYNITVKANKDNIPVFYCVNYGTNEGWTLISATQKFEPIIAFGESGYFDLDDPNNPTVVWIEDVSSAIERSIMLPIDSVQGQIHKWSKLLACPKGINQERKPRSRFNFISTEEYESLKSIVRQERARWESQGCRTFSVSANMTDYDWQMIGVPSQWGNAILETAQDEIYPIYTDCWEEFTFIVGHEEELYNNNLTTVDTHWHQGYPYNQAFPEIQGLNTKVGCGPLAAGQILYYYEYPSTFNWAAIKGYNPLPAISDMLYQVAEKSNAEYGIFATGTTPSNIVRTFNSYGYVAEFVDYNSNTPYPFIRVGDIYDSNSSNPILHLWVVSGYKNWGRQQYYDCWTFTNPNQLDYIGVSDYSYDYAYYHYYIWGWGSDYDGYYSVTSPCPLTNGNVSYYSNIKVTKRE